MKALRRLKGKNTKTSYWNEIQQIEMNVSLKSMGKMKA